MTKQEKLELLVETEKEGINPDLAIAQMLHHTGFFVNRDIYLKNRVAITTARCLECSKIAFGQAIILLT